VNRGLASTRAGSRCSSLGHCSGICRNDRNGAAQGTTRLRTIKRTGKVAARGRKVTAGKCCLSASGARAQRTYSQAVSAPGNGARRRRRTAEGEGENSSAISGANVIIGVGIPLSVGLYHLRAPRSSRLDSNSNGADRNGSLQGGEGSARLLRKIEVRRGRYAGRQVLESNALRLTISLADPAKLTRQQWHGILPASRTRAVPPPQRLWSRRKLGRCVPLAASVK
jgi:hypothetical protein